MSTQEQTEQPQTCYTLKDTDCASLVVCGASANRTILTFRADGKVVVGPGLSPDEATQLAVDGLVKMWAAAWPVVATKAMLDELSPADFLAAIAGRCKDCGTKTEGRTCHCTNDV